MNRTPLRGSLPTILICALAVGTWLTGGLARAEETWKAGAAKVKITPEKLLWMSGYGARDKPAEGTEQELWAKALVLEDPAGRRVALVTMDLVGIDRDLAGRVAAQLASQFGLERRQVAFNVSHTHCGPVVGRNLKPMYFLTDEQWQQIYQYTDELEKKLVGVVGEALAKLTPAQLSWGRGQATFAVNRRNNKAPEVPRLRELGGLVGPIDYDVPVLAVRDPQGKLVAVTCGYACHATVLNFYKFCGDYPGYAQAALEEQHPEAVALFWAGCGADQNPLPRQQLELAVAYGKRLAAAVEDVLTGTMRPVAGRLAASYQEIPLDLDQLPTRAEIEKDLASTNRYVVSRAKMLLAQIDRGQPLAATYPYPVQAWRVGSELQWVFLGGEVVVDYSSRLKRELGQGTTWVAGYSNDVMAYIPSLRVLNEGGYEGATAMIYYGLPTRWSNRVEEQIVKQVREQVAALPTEK